MTKQIHPFDRRVIFDGSFDPPTRGHMRVVHEALDRGATQVIVAVATSSSKNHLLDRGNAERLVKVMLHEAGLTRFCMAAEGECRTIAFNKGTDTRMRGFRDETDVSHEMKESERIGKQRSDGVTPGIDRTILVRDDGDLRISSTRGREILFSDACTLEKLEVFFTPVIAKLLLQAKEVSGLKQDNAETWTAFNVAIAHLAQAALDAPGKPTSPMAYHRP